MDSVRFGRTGMHVSRLCLGTMPFGMQTDPETSLAILDTAVEHGISFIDTADAYPQGALPEDLGRTEVIIGDWMRQRSNRDSLVIATKFWAPMGPQPWQRGGNRAHVMAAVEGSLRRLGTDHIDVYQIHFPDPETPIEETLDALNDVVRSGKVRYIGCSNFAAWQLARANGIAATNGWRRFDSVQPRYSALFRSYERDLFPLCELDDIAVMPYNPLAGGLLTGKHRNQAEPEQGTRFALDRTGVRYRARYWGDAEFAAVEALRPIAAEAGLGLIEMSIAWVLAQSAVTSVIIGASKPEQLAASIAGLDTELTPDVYEAIDEATSALRDRWLVT